MFYQLFLYLHTLILYVTVSSARFRSAAPSDTRSHNNRKTRDGYRSNKCINGPIQTRNSPVRLNSLSGLRHPRPTARPPSPLTEWSRLVWPCDPRAAQWDANVWQMNSFSVQDMRTIHCRLFTNPITYITLMRLLACPACGC